jgi:3'-5' exoribonuclease
MNLYNIIEDLTAGMAKKNLAGFILWLFAPGGQCATDFYGAAGSTGKHHAYKGGLAFHTVHATRLAASIADHYIAMGFNVDKDLVVAGTLLHDIGKSWSYSYDENGKPSYNEQAALLHHIPMGTIYISKAIDKWNEFADPALRINTALANNLLHIILSHHGRRAWSSPVIPQFVEAYIVHAVEMMDGKVEYYLTQGAPETLYD